MNGRLLDTNNDIFLVTGSDGLKHTARAYSFKEKIMRTIGTILRTEEGECFTDYEAGVPWFREFMGSSVLFVDEVSQEIKDRILSVEGVEKVEDIVVNVDGRNVSGKYKVKLIDGTTAIGDF